MAVSLDGLDPAFREKVEALLNKCLQSGVEMRPYFSIRHVDEQARLWRQSRATEEINAAIHILKQAGAPYIAEVLDRVGPQHGPHVTNSLPGLSWHQWGEAVDCFWAVNGRAEWSSSVLVNGINGYKFYASSARDAGLEAGGFWSSIKDWPHVQLRRFGSPVSAGMTLKQVNDAMKQKFGS